jgi:AraC family transcriptional regulator of adaptative response / DNA-3-methyladenine glycosylase II
VTRAVRLIAAGALDGNGTLEDLGARLGVGERHLRRLFAKHLGASPTSVAQSRRVHFARRLLDETTLPVTDVALSAGFSSVRRFNDVFRRTFAVPPTKARAVRRTRESDEVVLRLPFVPPYDWASMLGFLRLRAIPGVETAEDDVYRRGIELDAMNGGIEVRRVPGENCLRLRILAPFPVDLLRIAERVRRLFDLDCDPRQIARHFARDDRLADLVRKHPGLRVPGAWNPFEMSVRAILGQQVSVRGASTLAGRLADAYGLPATVPLTGITRHFPTADRLITADLEKIGLPHARADAIRNLARACSKPSLLLDGSGKLEETLAALNALPGVGDWTAQYIAMRALGEPDAFPAGDLGIRKALARNGHAPGTAEIIRRADAWRPFRAYAVMHLWRSLS